LAIIRLRYYSNLNTEAANYFETSVNVQQATCHIPGEYFYVYSNIILSSFSFPCLHSFRRTEFSIRQYACQPVQQLAATGPIRKACRQFLEHTGSFVLGGSSVCAYITIRTTKASVASITQRCWW
jgi:hypothetical protein